MPRASNAETGFVKDVSPGAGFLAAVRFPSGRVATDNGDLVTIGYGRRLHSSTDVDVRTGVIHRLEDASGVSGTGVVADFAEYPSDRVIMEWRNDENPDLSFDDTGLDVRPSMEAAVGIHGHGGRTEFVYDSGEVASP